MKSVGKVFKKVIKVVKKVALPALAIGAVVLTGGAALGVLPSVGSVLGGLGISGPLAGILTSAAKAATFGAVGSALTGGNIIKGASMGFLTGGVLGAVGAVGNAAGVAKTAAGAADAASGAVNTASAANAAAAAGVIQPTAATASAFGNAAGSVGGGLASGGGLAGAAASTAPVLAGAPAVAAVPSSGGILSSIFGGNSVIGGQMLSGLGQGLMQSAAMKDQMKAQEKERAARAASYEGLDQSLYRLPDGSGEALPNAADVYNQVIYRGSSAAPSKIKYDARTGRILPA